MIIAGLQNLELQLSELSLGDLGFAVKVNGGQTDIPVSVVVGVVIGGICRLGAQILKHVLVVVHIHLERADGADRVAGIQVNAELVTDG